MKQLLFAICAAVILNVFILCLLEAQHLVVIGMTPFAEIFVVVAGLLLVVSLFVFGMRKLDRIARSAGFEGYSPTFLFAAASFSVAVGSLFVGNSTIDIQMHDTYYVLADMNVQMGMAIVSGLFAGVYFCYPKIIRRPLVRALGYWHFGMTVCGLILFIISARMLMGELGGVMNFTGWLRWQRVSVLAMGLLLPGQLVFLFNLIYSGVRKKKSI